LARLEAGNKNMPVVIGAVAIRVQRYGAGRPGVIDPVEEEQFDACAVTREDAEVYPSGKESGA
jgi:hypothetical protein